MCILYNDTQKIKATSLDMALNKHIEKKSHSNSPATLYKFQNVSRLAF